MSRARCAAFTAVAALAALNLAACKSREEPDPRTALRLVEVAEVRAACDVEHTYTGVVAARVQSDLGFRVPGKIIARLVDTGQLVRRGQRLMLMDATDYTHAITRRQVMSPPRTHGGSRRRRMSSGIEGWWNPGPHRS